MTCIAKDIIGILKKLIIINYSFWEIKWSLLPEIVNRRVAMIANMVLSFSL
jgi:hypothetical protein